MAVASEAFAVCDFRFIGPVPTKLIRPSDPTEAAPTPPEVEIVIVYMPTSVAPFQSKRSIFQPVTSEVVSCAVVTVLCQ